MWCLISIFVCDMQVHTCLYWSALPCGVDQGGLRRGHTDHTVSLVLAC